CSSAVPVHPCSRFVFFFFFNDTPPTEIYTLSLHDALPIWREIYPVSHSRGAVTSRRGVGPRRRPSYASASGRPCTGSRSSRWGRSEEHTSELQSRENLVCRLLLEKKKKHLKVEERVKRPKC